MPPRIASTPDSVNRPVPKAPRSEEGCRLPCFTLRVYANRLWIYGPDRAFVMEAWPSLRGWTRNLDQRGGWKPFPVIIDLATGFFGSCFMDNPHPLRELRLVAMGGVPRPNSIDWNALLAAYEPVRRFFSTIPVEYAEAASAYGLRQSFVLKMLARGGRYGVELARTNGGLTMLLANAYDKGSLPLPLEEVLRLKRRDICGILGFPAEETSVRILTKIAPEHCSPHRDKRLSEVFQHGLTLKVLQHLPSLSRQSIQLAISEVRSRVTPAFYWELETRAYTDSQFWNLQRDIEEIDRICERVSNLPRPPQCFSNVRQLERCLDHYRRLNDEWECIEYRRMALPSPPFPGTTEVFPLRTAELMIEAAQEQGNCLAEMVPDVAGGNMYVYRYDGPPGKATFSVIRREHGWNLGEMAAYGKAWVDEGVKRAITAWATQQGIFIQRGE